MTSSSHQNNFYSPMGYIERVVRKLYSAAEGFTYLKENVMLSSDKKLIVKVFKDLTQYQREVASFDVLSSLKEKIPTPGIVFSEDLKNGYYLLGMTYEGESVEQQIGQGKSAYSLCKAVGVLLKQLHTSTQGILQSDHLSEHGKVKKMVQKVDDMLVRDFLRNPGVGGYTHGDASISNFVVDPAKNEVKMIDFAGVVKYGQHGIPAYEYYQFLSSLDWKVTDKEVIEEGRKGFIEGYGETEFTKEADTLMRTYWEKASDSNELQGEVK